MPGPLIVLGAARSGTKILRDVLASAPGVRSVPYDINYIWRLGNESCPHDEIKPEQHSLGDQERIRELILAYASPGDLLVEKTVSNCLRVSFVDAVFPDAHYVILVRNGYDVAESAARQWEESRPDLRYLLAKMRGFPIHLAPRYAAQYAKRTLKRSTGAATSWGPRYRGIEEDIENLTTLEVCARQWARSVEASIEGISSLDPTRVITLSYGDFVRNPRRSINGIADMFDDRIRIAESSSIHSSSLGRGTTSLSRLELELIRPTIEPVHERLSSVGLSV